MWRLWQRRHLIVHKRGLVDQSYINKTGDALKVGSRLVITGTDIDAIFKRIRDTGTALVLALKAL